ncbi:hypothetical protein [Salininema proteolyticum]|uniref:Uncharacterized protein n=1 Tax=Salininema proteolyticum TaxID=1607685 RepID=A0ABV8TVU9_9ACTN
MPATPEEARIIAENEVGRSPMLEELWRLNASVEESVRICQAKVESLHAVMDEAEQARGDQTAALTSATEKTEALGVLLAGHTVKTEDLATATVAQNRSIEQMREGQAEHSKRIDALGVLIAGHTLKLDEVLQGQRAQSERLDRIEAAIEKQSSHFETILKIQAQQSNQLGALLTQSNYAVY